jgi:molybdopterin/thiamine biosynthesis adenylyltransferase
MGSNVAAAHLVLDQLKVAVIGAGSVGARIALHCARLLVAGLWVADHSVFSRENLLTSPILSEAIGKPKASHIGALSKEISPATRVFVFDGSFQDLDMSALWEVDLVLLASDNLAAEAVVGRRCLQLGKPLVHASVQGETLVAQVRFFANDDADGPCPTCGFGAEEMAQLTREVAFSCAGPSASSPQPRAHTLPTRSVSSLCSLAADLAMTQLLRHALHLGKPLVNSMVELCGYTWKSVVSPLARNPDCPSDHVRWQHARAPRPLAACSPAELLAATGLGHGTGLALSPSGAVPNVSFMADHFSFAASGACACGAAHPLQRFVEAGQALAESCSACGQVLHVEPFFSLKEVPAAALCKVWDRPLRELGLPDIPSVLLRSPSRSVILRHQP